jgi:hypothetical protein
MKRILFSLSLLACSAAHAQLFSNPSTVTPFATVQATGIVLDQVSGAQFAQRTGIDRCRLLLRVDTSPKYFRPTQPGHSIPWASDANVPVGAYRYNVWNTYVWDAGPMAPTKGQWSGASTDTDAIAKSDKAQRIASSSTSSSSSSSSSSSTVSTWNNGNGKTTTESTAETSVTINGKTYRTFKHELNTTPEPIEPQSYLDGAYYCY